MSDFVFESGEAIDLGAHGDHDYVFASGEPVPDTGVSSLVFESGTGLGGGNSVTIRDDAGEETAALPLIEDSQTIENWYDYGGGGGSFGSSGAGQITNWTADNYVTVLLYRNTSSGDVSAVAHYDKVDTGTPGGDIESSWSDIPGDWDLAVEDDPGEISFNPPSATGDQNYTVGACDGWAIRAPSAGTMTWDMDAVKDNTQGVAPPDFIRYIGSDGSTIERSLGTDTQVEISISP